MAELLDHNHELLARARRLRGQPSKVGVDDAIHADFQKRDKRWNIRRNFGCVAYLVCCGLRGQRQPFRVLALEEIELRRPERKSAKPLGDSAGPEADRPVGRGARAPRGIDLDQWLRGYGEGGQSLHCLIE